MDWLDGLVNPALLDEQVIANRNRWDIEDWAQIHREMVELAVATDAIADSIPKGRNLMQDAFYVFKKWHPELHDRESVRPDTLINLVVMQQAQTLPVLTRLRRFTVGDDVASAFACIEMQPHFEALVDRHQALQQRLEEMQAHAEELHAALAQRAELSEEDEASAERRNLLDRLITALSSQIEADGESLDSELGNTAQRVALGLELALQKAADQARDFVMGARAWGLDSGALTRLPAAERIALARRIANPRLQEIGRLFGAAWLTFLDVRSRKVPDVPTDLLSVTQGNNLERILPTELVRYLDPNQRLSFVEDFIEGRLLQYEMEGIDPTTEGAIIWVEDGSQSMSCHHPDEPSPEMWAKAIGLCFLHYARQEGRAFHAVHFGGPCSRKKCQHNGPPCRSIMRFDFVEASDFTTERIIAFAEAFFNGGTDFELPLTVALGLLQAEHSATGRVEGDIVFCTDGLCRVRPKWMSKFHAEQERLGFTTWGIFVGSSLPPHSPGDLASICSNRLAVVEDLLALSGVTDVFAGV